MEKFQNPYPNPPPFTGEGINTITAQYTLSCKANDSSGHGIPQGGFALPCPYDILAGNPINKELLKAVDVYAGGELNSSDLAR